MKYISRIKLAFTAGALSAALVTSSFAQTPVKPEDGSKHFAAVARHLEVGGLFFGYMDVDGDLAALGKLGDKFINLARAEQEDIPKELSAAAIIEALGLNSVKAIGLSTRAAGPELFHNRALLYMPEGPKGLLKLFGGKAAPLQIASWAPADTGIAFQMDLSLSALVETAEAVLKAGGQDNVLAQFKFGMSVPLPGLDMKAGELMEKLNTRVMFALRVDESKKLTLPGMPVELPGMQMMLAFDDVDFLMAPLLGMAESDDNLVVEKSDGVTVIRPNSSLPGDLDYFKPGLLHEAKTKRMVLTTHLDMARQAGKGDTLGSSAEFKTATAGLPAEGNGLTFASPRCLRSLAGLAKTAMDEALKSGAGGAGAEQAGKLLLDLFLTVPSGPVASVYANVPEGMLFASNTTSSHKGTVISLNAMPMLAITAAGAFSGYRSVMDRARETRAEAEKAREQAEKEIERLENGGGAPNKAVKNNLQQIVLAAQTWFIDHAGDKEVTYETLVKNELIFELDPVSGETYKGLTIKRAGGELNVKLKGGGSLSHKYQAVTD